MILTLLLVACPQQLSEATEHGLLCFIQFISLNLVPNGTERFTSQLSMESAPNETQFKFRSFVIIPAILLRTREPLRYIVALYFLLSYETLSTEGFDLLSCLQGLLCGHPQM